MRVRVCACMCVCVCVCELVVLFLPAHLSLDAAASGSLSVPVFSPLSLCCRVERLAGGRANHAGRGPWDGMGWDGCCVLPWP